MREFQTLRAKLDWERLLLEAQTLDCGKKEEEEEEEMIVVSNKEENFWKYFFFSYWPNLHAAPSGQNPTK